MIMKILIADDEPDVRMILKKLLEPYGELTACNDGQQAFDTYSKAVDSEPFDLVCLDISMPILTGREALVKIRDFEKEKNISKEKCVKIMMITAHSNINNFIASFEEGCEIFLPKPFDKEQLQNNLKVLKLI
jgi:two-component system chemotaxis response regulator CheY